MSVVNIRETPGEKPKYSNPTIWITLGLTVLGMAGSALLSLVVMGIYIGQFRETLDEVTKRQESDRNEFKKNLSDLTSLANLLNANLQGVNVGLVGLKDALNREREDRMNSDIRRRADR